MVEHENRNQQIESEPHEQWQLLAEMEDLGYWVGSTYNGQHRQRLELNIPLFESACRILDLPVVKVHSAEWNPPAEKEPEMVGLGTMAWKKVSLPSWGGEHEDESYEITQTWEGEEVVMNYEGDALIRQIPYGWNLGIRDRKFERDFNRNRAQPDKKQEERYFIDQFNNSLWRGLLAIALKERGEERLKGYGHVDEDGPRRVVSCAAEAFAALSLHGAVGALTHSPGEALSFAVAGASITGVEAGYAIVNKDKHGTDSLRSHNRLSMLVTNRWRQENYPERYAKEKHGIGAIDSALIHALPFVGIAYEKQILHHVYRYIQELQGHDSFVRLRKD